MAPTTCTARSTTRCNVGSSSWSWRRSVLSRAKKAASPALVSMIDHPARAAVAASRRWFDLATLLRRRDVSPAAARRSAPEARSRIRLSSRETCIWVTPMSSAISCCVHPRKKRSIRIRRSRSPRRRTAGARTTRASAADMLTSSPPRRSPRDVSPSVPTGLSRLAGVKQPSVASASVTSSRSASRCAAISLGRGERPRAKDSSASVPEIRAWSSWIRRGGRTVQPWSRKCRLSSPRMVGTQ